MTSVWRNVPPAHLNFPNESLPLSSTMTAEKLSDKLSGCDRELKRLGWVEPLRLGKYCSVTLPR
jgi:hypothetical protein